jgi:hypothetical protein
MTISSCYSVAADKTVRDYATGHTHTLSLSLSRARARALPRSLENVDCLLHELRSINLRIIPMTAGSSIRSYDSGKKKIVTLVRPSIIITTSD